MMKSQVAFKMLSYQKYLCRLNEQYSVVENINSTIRPDNLDTHIRFALQEKFAKSLQENMPEFRRSCGMIFIERFKHILNNYLNISTLPQNVTTDMKERIFPLGLTLQLTKMQSMETLHDQVKFFWGRHIKFKFFHQCKISKCQI